MIRLRLKDKHSIQVKKKKKESNFMESEEMSQWLKHLIAHMKL